MSELPKAYLPGEVEEKWYQRWLDARSFHGDEKSSKPAYSIVIPPPNVTGILHLGHVLNNTLQDILARRARMTGHEVCWLPGTDHAGIATQTKVEQQLRKEEKKTRRDLGREEFLKRVWDWKEKYGGIIIQQLKRLGCSCDWERERFTMDEGYVQAVLNTFVDLHSKGLIYRGRRMVNWCPKSLTALSDEEVIMKEQRSKLYTMRYELVSEPGRYLEIATTRPETLMGDTAVAVNPHDERYQQLIGQSVWRPFPKAQIPIVADDHVDFEFGTGVLKVTPAHDKADYEIGLRHGLPAIDLLNADGTMNELAGEEFAGLDRFEARKLAVAKLAEMGLLVKEEDYVNKVGFSERADVPIEPRLSLQWFLKYPSIEEAKRVVRDGEIIFRPERWTKTYLHWLENIQDWCISRQLWWGHRIPAWYQNKGESNEEIRVQIESPGVGWEQDEDVMDTWFSSWLWPFATMDEGTKGKFYPTTDLVTGPDIIFFWVARMIMAGLEYEGRIPFRNVFYTSIIRDKQGRKMAKQLGNSPDPLDLIAKYGADGLRFGLLRISPTGTDVKFDEAQIEEGRNFANKLWNACRFRQMQPAAPAGSVEAAKLSIYAVDILAKLDALTNNLTEALANYEFNTASNLLYEFFWGNYCDLYLETIKGDTTEGTLQTQDLVLQRFLALLHPFMPHVTEELWEKLGFAEAGCYLMREQLSAEPVLASAEASLVAESAARASAIYSAAARARNLKAEYNLAANKSVRFALKPAANWVAGELGVLKILAGAGEISMDAQYAAPSGTPVTLTDLGELYLPLEGLVDKDAERKRLDKELAKVEEQISKAEANLSNPNFVSKVPAAVLDEHRKRLADFTMKRTQLQEMLRNLG